MSQRQGVWITGIGTANPLGTSYAETARNLLAGTPGVRAVDRFDVTQQHSKIAGQVPVIPAPVVGSFPDFARLDRMDQLALWCGTEALRNSGWWGRQSEVRMGLVLGNGGEWLRLWEADRIAGGERIHQPERDDRTTAQFLARTLGLTGPVLTTASACASGNYALSEARKWVLRGWVDVCLVGAVDLTLGPMGLSAFGNLRALSTKRNSARTGVATLRQGPRWLRHVRRWGGVRGGIAGSGTQARGEGLRGTDRLRGQQRCVSPGHSKQRPGADGRGNDPGHG